MCAERPVSILLPLHRRRFPCIVTLLLLHAVPAIQVLMLLTQSTHHTYPLLFYADLYSSRCLSPLKKVLSPPKHPQPPTKIARYLLRAELIALHAASSYPGAQLYMECAQIAVTGGGNGNPATVSFPGAYKGTDPGIKFQLYWPVPTSYTIPGPRPFVC